MSGPNLRNRFRGFLNAVDNLFFWLGSIPVFINITKSLWVSFSSTPKDAMLFLPAPSSPVAGFIVFVFLEACLGYVLGYIAVQCALRANYKSVAENDGPIWLLLAALATLVIAYTTFFNLDHWMKTSLAPQSHFGLLMFVFLLMLSSALTIALMMMHWGKGCKEAHKGHLNWADLEQKVDQYALKGCRRMAFYLPVVAYLFFVVMMTVFYHQTPYAQLPPPVSHNW